jgi:4-hydroxybenzoate polyprenyltransferase
MSAERGSNTVKLDVPVRSDGPASGWSATLGTVWPYVQIARVDHWVKNAFMLLGVVVALFYHPGALSWGSAAELALAVMATCLVASSNYVLNELIDGPTDRLHPEKRHRPVPSGKVRAPIAYVEWILLGVAGLLLAWFVNPYFTLAAAWLWAMGVAYNVPPVRTKEWPYLDVLSEAVNNVIRLLLGWFALIPDRLPPLSLMLAYWMAGAFFMATKRFGEYRRIADRGTAAAYRRSFQHYTEERLLVSMMFYVTACALFAGVFIVRYHLELVLFVPFAAGFFAYYLKLGLKTDSPAQHPERLHQERGFLLYTVGIAVLFVLLLFVRIPVLYEWFHVEAAGKGSLWQLSGAKPGPEPRADGGASR